ncbi:MAG: hypothetical protein ACO1SV_08580 [Fimbriimonas sp.]
MRYGETDEQRATKIAKSAIRHLLHDSKDPALALVHRVSERATPETLPGRAVYERMAAAEGLFVVEATQAMPDGFDHVLFLAKEANLSLDRLLACRRAGSRNRHAAGDGP